MQLAVYSNFRNKFECYTMHLEDPVILTKFSRRNHLNFERTELSIDFVYVNFEGLSQRVRK